MREPGGSPIFLSPAFLRDEAARCSYVLTILAVQPEVTLPTKRISQVRGKDTILECMVSAHPQGQAMWKFHGKQITSNDKYSVSSTALLAYCVNEMSGTGHRDVPRQADHQQRQVQRE